MPPLPTAAAVRPVVLALAAPAPGLSRGAATPSLELLGGSRLIDRLLGTLHGLGLPVPLVVTVDDSAPQLRAALGRRIPVVSVPGGRRSALQAVLERTDEELLLLHDAERALTPAAVVTEVLSAIEDGIGAVVPVVALTDSVKEVRPDGLRNIDRTTLAGLQSPRLLRRDLLERVLGAAAAEGTPDAGIEREHFDEILVALDGGAQVRTVQGSHSGFAVRDRLTLWQAQISLGLARDTSHRRGISRRG